MSDTLESIQEELDGISEKLAARKKAALHLDDLYHELTEMRAELKVLYNILKKEEEDVNKLQSLSVNGLFRLFLKDKDNQLEIEQQEYVVAALRYNECLDAINLLEFEIDVLEKLMEEEADLEKRFSSFLIKKELALKDVRPEVKSTLETLDYKITRRRIALKEVNEALKAGTAAKEKLLEISKALAKVEGWGEWSGSYTYKYQSLYSRRSFIDRARAMAVEAKRLLRSFENEVKDVFEDLQVKEDLTLDAFHSFLGIFYDNMITDWIVQNKLRYTRNSLDGTIGKVDRLIASLNREKRQLEAAITDFKTNKRNIILTNQ